MTPEREDLVRQVAANGGGCDDPFCTAGRCAAFDILAELDALRAKVKALDVYLVGSYEWWSGASAKADAFRAALTKGRELGLFEDPEAKP